MNTQPIWDFVDWLGDWKLFGDFSALHLVGLIVAAAIAHNVYRAFRPSFQGRRYMVHVRCNECGWLGEVSKFAKVCRKCKGTSLRLLTPEDAKDLEKAVKARR